TLVLESRTRFVPISSRPCPLGNRLFWIYVTTALAHNRTAPALRFLEILPRKMFQGGLQKRRLRRRVPSIRSRAGITVLGRAKNLVRHGFFSLRTPMILTPALIQTTKTTGPIARPTTTRIKAKTLPFVMATLNGCLAKSLWMYGT